jgi:DNA-binding NtrC family response regulator
MANIMIVDDQNEQLELYAREFSEDGHSIIPVNNGRDVLDKIKESNPALIVLNVPLRDIDGLEVLERIRGSSNKMPVILNSTYSDIKNNFASWLADDCIIKSSDLTELKSVIKKYASS